MRQNKSRKARGTILILVELIKILKLARIHITFVFVSLAFTREITLREEKMPDRA